MNTFSHIKIAGLLYRHLKNKYGIKMNYIAFVLGNITPDFCVGVVRNPHYIENHNDFIRSEISDICEKIIKSNGCLDVKLSKRIGTICHFYTDFFCFVHNKEFDGTSAAHLNYENRLHKYFKSEYDILNCFEDFDIINTSCNVSEINDFVLNLHGKFSVLEPTFERDLKYGLAACMQSIVFILASGNLQNVIG